MTRLVGSSCRKFPLLDGPESWERVTVSVLQMLDHQLADDFVLRVVQDAGRHGSNGNKAD